MKYLGEKGIMAAGIESPSMGPLPDLAVATHQVGGALGMIWVECGTNFKALPATGAFYALLRAGHAGGSGGEARVIAITEPKLAAPPIAAVRVKCIVQRRCGRFWRMLASQQLHRQSHPRAHHRWM